ncbi:MAG: hypothetical protein K8T20_17360 [Planctomycetes bacterium]|nr:hypothetical protein [Planctomycetota bacterium]
MKPALIFVLAAIGALSISEAFLIRRQESRIRDLEATLARQATPEGAAEILRRAGPDSSRPGDVTAQSEAGAAAARKAADTAVAEQTAELERRLAALEKSSATAGTPGGDPAAIDELVAKKVDEKLGGKKEKKGGLFGDDKKRPLADVSKDLALTELQEDQLADAIKASQKTVFDLITTPRNDGTNILDDLVLALQDPEHAEEKAKAAFMQIFTAKLPGSEETYLGKIMTEKQTLLGEFHKILTEDQMKKYDRLGQDPHEIQTGYDPYGEYIMQRMGKK